MTYSLFDQQVTKLLSELDGSFREHSLESLNPAVLSDKIALLCGSASRTLSSVGESLINAKLSFHPTADLDRILSQLDYVGIRQVTVTKPVGLKVTYATFADSLLETAQHLQNIEDDCLDKVKKVLSKLYGETAELAGSFKYREFENLNQYHQKVSLCKETIKGCFDPKSTNSYANYGDMFVNTSEVNVVKGKITELNLLIKKIDLKKVRKELAEVTELSDDLAKVIKVNNLVVSSQMAASLSALLYNAAEAAETLGVLLTMQAILNNTYEQARLELRNKLK